MDLNRALLDCFPKGRIGSVSDGVYFFAYSYKNCNEGFYIREEDTELSLKRKAIEFLSRASFKSEPFSRPKENRELHTYMLSSINSYLGTSFTEKDMELIYTKLGNGIKSKLCEEFIFSDYNMEVLR